MKRLSIFHTLFLFILTLQVHAAGTWVKLANTPPAPIGHFLVLPDGTVMGEANPNALGPGWYRLVPDSHGSYVNGTWSNMPSMRDTRLDFDSLVLTNGKVFVAGGEYGSGKGTAELYDPGLSTWTVLNIPTNVIDTNTASPIYSGNQAFADSCAVVLADGRVLTAPVFARSAGGTVIYNPASNAWSVGPSALGSANSQNEASWVQLPDQSILTVNINSTFSQRYIPALNKWIQDATVPVSLFSGFGAELGPAVLLPNGKAIFFGGTNGTAIYTPSGNTNLGTWVAGPNFPNGQGMPDAPAAMLSNGKVLCVTEQAPTNGTVWYAPCSFYEYDYTANSFTRVSSPTGGNTFNDVCWPTLLAALPDGTVLFGHRQSDFYIYKPDGVPIAAGKPTLTSFTTNLDGSMHVTGKLFNGISAGASYGDDEQMDGNFPLVRFTDPVGIVRYGRTYNWSSSGVMTGDATQTTECIKPPGASLTDDIQVVVNGFASDLIVETTNDSGPGSLRRLTQILPSGSTIKFADYLSGKSILLTNGEILLSSNLTIDASSLAAGITINGGKSNRLFEVAAGVAVTMNSLTLTNGYLGAGNVGGAIFVNGGGTLALNRCTVAGNSVDSASSIGGGIYSDGAMTLTACAFYSNSAHESGAIRNNGVCTLVNCTFAKNTVLLNGGAIDNVFGALTIKQCTFSGNSANGLGGGIDNYQGTVNITNSILGGNTAGGNGPDIFNWASSTFNFGGSNLVQALGNNGTINGANTISSAAPQLSDLGNYGGPTKTMPPLITSPAFDSGNDSSANGITTDQRGFPRISGPHVDIGAAEIPLDPVIANTADSGYGSLRYVTTYVSNNAVVTFSPGLAGQSIKLTSGQISFAKNITIDASGLPGGLAIDGNNSDRAFEFDGGNVALNSITISNANGGSAAGGAIFSYASLTLNNCKLLNNQTGGPGGALGVVSPSLTMSNTTIANNFSGNCSGVYLQGGVSVFSGCTINGNSGSDAIRLNAATTPVQLSLTNCTVAANTASVGPSAITLASAAGFTAKGIFVNSTIVSNSASAGGQPGAVYLQPGGGGNSLALYNTIVARNTTGGVESDITGAVDANSANNFIGAGGGLANGVNGNQVGNTNPQLAALGNYGGLTQTMPPLATSPVIDAGGDGFITGTTNDQTGAPRVAGPHVDIGAVELPVGSVALNTADSGYGSLRYVMAYATNGANITFSSGLSGQIITLVSGEILLSKNVGISALTLPGGISLNGNHTSRLMEVANGVTATLDSLTFTNGYMAGAYGGALQNSGSLTMNRCTFAGNSTDNNGVGGAMYNLGTLVMTACTLSSNSSQFAGALRNDGTCTLINCTATGNTAPVNGGAIDNVFGSLTLKQCTFAGNSAGSLGGGIDNYQGTVNITNSILAVNSAGTSGPDIFNWASSTFNFGGSNLVQALGNNGTVNGTATILTAVPQLAALGNYGGPTKTMPPLTTSPAIDAGDDTSATGITNDQTGALRIVGPHVDIGAVELPVSPVVLNTADSGYGSLRYGVTYASNNATLTFAPGLAGQSIKLTSGEIQRSQNLTIDASGLPGGMAIDGNNSSRAFRFFLGINVVLNSLTISNANCGVNFGGAILSQANLTLNNCKLIYNQSGQTGGAMTAASGSLVMNNTTVASNFCDNCSGIYLQNEQATLIGCTFNGNNGAFGDAVRLNSPSLNSQLNAINCTITGNSVASGPSAVTIQSFNSSTAAGYFTNCTITGNSVANSGQPGAVYIQPGGGVQTLGIFNTIVAGNTTSGSESDITGNLNAGSANNFIGLGGGLVNGVNGNQVGNANPQLAKLGSYGGLTQTMPPLSASPAIDTGSDAVASGLTLDQRGYPRITGTHVDIGAVEAQITSQAPVLKSIFTTGGDGTFRFGFSNLVGGSFTVFAGTNITQPFNAWQNLGPTTEVPPGSGQFQFSDPQAVNYPQRFYKVRSP